MQMRLITVHVRRSYCGNMDSLFCCVHNKHRPTHCSVLALPLQHTVKYIKITCKALCACTGSILSADSCIYCS